MLPPFIIEQIRQREEEEARHEAVLELPLPAPVEPENAERRRDDEQPERGVVIIDLMS